MKNLNQVVFETVYANLESMSASEQWQNTWNRIYLPVANACKTGKIYNSFSDFGQEATHDFKLWEEWNKQGKFYGYWLSTWKHFPKCSTGKGIPSMAVSLTEKTEIRVQLGQATEIEKVGFKGYRIPELFRG